MSTFTRRDFLKLVSMGIVGQFVPKVISAPIFSSTENNLPNILILLFDAWSAKNVSFYGYGRDTMPNLARLLNRAIVFNNHYATSTFTTPGTASILTGRYPWSHRAVHGAGLIDPSTSDRNIFRLLSDDYFQIAYSHNSFADRLIRQVRISLDEYKSRPELLIDKDFIFDRLLANDFEVANIVRQLCLSNHVGIFQSTLILQRLYLALRKNSIEEWVELYPRGLPQMGDSLQRFVLEDGIDWLAEKLPKWPSPNLAYFHFLPPHAPYNTRIEFVNWFNEDGFKPVSKPIHPLSYGFGNETMDKERRLYDEYVLYVDREFGRLYEKLDRQGVLDNLWIFLTSDHGEFFERGEVRHTTRMLHQPIVQVPLIVFPPGRKQRLDVHLPTNAVDLVPTILQMAGKKIPEWCEGMPLPLGNEDKFTERPVYALQAEENPLHSPLETVTLMMVQGRYKVMKALGYEQLGGEQLLEVYDLENDPEELNNLLTSQPNLARELGYELDMKLEQVNRKYTQEKT